MSARKTLDELAKQDHSKSDKALFEFYDSLPPVTVEEMVGDWKGTNFKITHWAYERLDAMRWYGKSFRGNLEAYPLITYDDNGDLIANQAMNGNATLWMIEFRGKVSATMSYDSVPIFDHFRKVDDRTLMAVMNGKTLKTGEQIVDNGHWDFFYLEKVDKLPAPLKL